ncbi:MAG: hydrolase [Gammaproteobacteria bacterium]|nr:hydrolase [Gammaproteobacteria bacterium]MBU1416770.1 hydrolase [Gammaproteobacteria bacterium]
MLISAENSSLLVVDVQDKLLHHVHDWQALLRNVIWLVKVARRIGVPVMASEQFPKGLGATNVDLANELPGGAIVEKVHFSCGAAQCLPGLPGSDRSQIVVCGMETHVCVLQTAIELQEQGKTVFVVGDVVGSRSPLDKALALERMRDHGVQIVSREMVAFEWLRKAGTPLFKEISMEFLR